MAPFVLKTASGCDLELHPTEDGCIDLVIQDGPCDGYSATLTLNEASVLQDALGDLILRIAPFGPPDPDGGIAP